MHVIRKTVLNCNKTNCQKKHNVNLTFLKIKYVVRLRNGIPLSYSNFKCDIFFFHFGCSEDS